MSVTISIGSAADVALALGQIAARLGQGLEPEMTAATTMLREYIVSDKLSGSPLTQRSGRASPSRSRPRSARVESRPLVSSRPPFLTPESKNSEGGS